LRRRAGSGFTRQRHYGSRAHADADGNYYLVVLNGYMWTDGFIRTDSLPEATIFNTRGDKVSGMASGILSSCQEIIHGIEEPGLAR
jgi:hypothetical protein